MLGSLSMMAVEEVVPYHLFPFLRIRRLVSTSTARSRTKIGGSSVSPQQAALLLLLISQVIGQVHFVDMNLVSSVISALDGLCFQSGR